MDRSPTGAIDQSQVRRGADPIVLFLCGDVMTGRGIDQILPHPGDPALHEPYMTSAVGYVELAESVNGPLPRPVDFSYPWSDALEAWRRRAPDVRVVNLETAVTASDDYGREKAIHYRMHPANIGCLTAAGVHCCTLANNHVLDWGTAGLVETLETLHRSGVKWAGAGRTRREAEAPAILEIAGKGRIVIYACGLADSGIPWNWGAAPDRPGVNLLPDLSETTVRHIKEQIYNIKRPGDVAVVSVHWGENWDYDIPRAQTRFARRLIDEAGADVIHGHSSHHVKAIEVYKDRPILYGCGDFLNDYEGISGYEHFRDDLTVMYFLRLEPSSGALVDLDMVPLQIRRFRLNRASPEDALWLREVFAREGARFGTRVEMRADHSLSLRWR